MTALQVNKHLIAIVDANSIHREEVLQSLLSFYFVHPYMGQREGMIGLSKSPPALVLVGEKVPPEDGASFIRAMRQDPMLADTPVIYIMEKPHAEKSARAAAAGASGILVKPYLRSRLINTISSHLNASVERSWEALPEMQRMALKGTVEVFNGIADVISTGEPLPFGAVRDACGPLVTAIANNDFKGILGGLKNHDNYTYVHSMRVATLLALFGHAAGLKGTDQSTLTCGGLLHDVGKMLIPHFVLNKPGKLDEEETAIMRQHVPKTVEYLKTIPDIPKAVIVIAEQHHEKLDGKGYPHGLHGDELNDLARMAAIVDVFSALTDRRVYKPPMEAEAALNIMTHEMGTHLDQRFLKTFKTTLLDAVA